MFLTSDFGLPTRLKKNIRSLSKKRITIINIYKSA